MGNYENLHQQVSKVPNNPGIYLFHNQGGKVIYVGKAGNLNKRVRSYFNKKQKYIKVATMVKEIATIDYYVTENEVEALIMENNFIKKLQPEFNVAYRDDKSYPYLAISLKEAYPRLRYTRESKRRDTRYFGPYPSANAMRETLDLLISVFPIRSCSDSLFKRAKISNKPCLYFHINRCSAPCVGKINPEEYGRLVASITAFLEGRQEQVITDLERRMKTASATREFEQAAYYRDRLAAARKILIKQKVSTDSRLDQDIFGLAVEKDISSVQLLKVRNGKLIGTEDFILDKGRGVSSEELLGSLIKQYYLNDIYLPKEVLVSAPLSDAEVISASLSGARGARVKIVAPQRGVKKRLVNMAVENAVHALDRYKTRFDFETSKITAALANLKESLNLEKMDIIECYDISTISGQNSVGSMVTFKAGRPQRQAYRRFKVRNEGSPNDYAMMKEVLSRRFSHFLAEEEGGFALKPNLVIVDGGKPQLRAALEVFSRLDIVGIPVVGLAKKEEEIYLPGQSEPLVLERGSEELHLMERIRDEAHRFAHSYHQKLRRGTMKVSVLDKIEGIGPARKQKLLRRFGSVSNIKKVDIKELEPVVGKVLAVRLVKELKVMEER